MEEGENSYPNGTDSNKAEAGKDLMHKLLREAIGDHIHEKKRVAERAMQREADYISEFPVGFIGENRERINLSESFNSVQDDQTPTFIREQLEAYQPSELFHSSQKYDFSGLHFDIKSPLPVDGFRVPSVPHTVSKTSKASNATPRATSKLATPRATCNQVTSKATSRQATPRATSKQATKVVRDTIKCDSQGYIPAANWRSLSRLSKLNGGNLQQKRY